jgi:hypothetical protein
MVGFSQLTEVQQNKIHATDYAALAADKGHGSFDGTDVIEAAKAAAKAAGAENFGKGGGNQTYIRGFITWLQTNKATDDKVLLRVRVLGTDPAVASASKGKAVKLGENLRALCALRVLLVVRVAQCACD